jgi:16S rRNA (guanine1207-N2)-methyltransferase
LTQSSAAACVYGAPSPELATTPAGARQVSPLIPGAEALEALAPGSLTAAVIAARSSGATFWRWRCARCAPARR